MVWVIREFQPDVIITRFPEDKRAGHGQHSASAVLARLAFKAAADPNQFPEQFAYGVHPWKAKRLFLNTFRFGNINTTSEDQMKIEVGGYNALEGKSYGEIAADSRSQHRSQGFGIPHSRGNVTEYFTETEGEKADSSLMENINCSWNRIPGGDAIDKQIQEMITKYNPSDPYRSVPDLIVIYKTIKSLPAGYWREEKCKKHCYSYRPAADFTSKPQCRKDMPSGIKQSLLPSRSKPGAGFDFCTVCKYEPAGYDLEPGFTAGSKLFTAAGDITEGYTHFPALLAGRTHVARLL